MESDAETRKRLRALAPFAHRFQSPGFDFGQWVHPPARADGVLEFPYFAFSTEASDFIRTCYEVGWVQEFDWPGWKSSPEAIQLRDCPAAIEEASPDQLGRLLTVLIRQDRFVEGALNGAFESGFLVRILQRIASLARFALPFKSEEEVRCWAERYCSGARREEWALEEALEKIIAPKARQLGYLNREDLFRFCKWKSPRALTYCEENIEAYVNDITHIAFSCQNERVRIEILTLLRGVSWPMASVVLHF